MDPSFSNPVEPSVEKLSTKNLDVGSHEMSDMQTKSTVCLIEEEPTKNGKIDHQL